MYGIIGINKSNNDMGFMEDPFENLYLGMASLSQGIFIIPEPDWSEENGLGDADLKCERCLEVIIYFSQKR